jgi:hypothetical protein
MKLGELKKSLSRFPPDMDDMEIICQYVDDKGNEDTDLLLYVAYAKIKENVFAICLGTWKSADKMQARDPSKFPDDYKTHPDTKKHTDEES